MIQNLDDTAAQEILSTIARSKASRGDGAVSWSPELKQALAALSHDFQPKAEATLVSEGELARQALLVLAEDPETRSAIETMAVGWKEQRQRQKFDFGASMAITAAVLVVLQTHVRFERTRDGKWSLKIEKKPASEALLKGLVQKLINFAK
jgi:hypothetical protein